MKSLYKILLVVILTSLVFVCNGQQPEKLANGFGSIQIDTTQVNLLIDKADSYYFLKPDTCLILVKQALAMAEKLNYAKGELQALNLAGESFRSLGDYPQALEMQFRALEIVKKYRKKNGEGMTLGFIGFTYADLKEYRQALNYLLEAKKIYGSIPNSVASTFNWSNIGYAYEGLNFLDSALYYQLEAQTKSATLPHKNLRILTLTRLGVVYSRQGKDEEALNCYHRALRNTYEIGDRANLAKIQNKIALLYLNQNQQDSSLYYARLAHANAEYIFQQAEILETSNLLVKLFRNKKMSDSVIYYLDKTAIVNNNLFGPEKLKQVQLFALREQKRQQEVLQEQEQYKNNAKIIALGVMLGFALLIAILFYRNIRHKQKVNVVLQQQKEEIQTTLTELKATQAQLIQSEKMASLGELTAGIAHEIQNPLNFVNNFSEVNEELLTELKNELSKGKTEAAITLANNVIENQKKINNHGQRADAIVKGMLLHSRTSSGLREPTDINALAEEYLRLAYHGIRAKDNSFTVATKTDFDESIGRIDVVPQEIGRVILNLINNAFYAVNEKSKQNIAAYEPAVSVSSKKIKNKVEIKVEDNGNGIPASIKEKIFLPFFTTKPAGQGTGLGLSLSYDIVKAHGGELRVETTKGEGSAFIITLLAD